MSTQALVLPVTIDYVLIGGAVLHITAEVLDVLKDMSARGTAGIEVSGADKVTFLDAPEPNAFVTSEVLQEYGIADLFEADAGYVIVPDVSALQVEPNTPVNYPAGMTDLGFVRGLHLNVGVTGFLWWRGIASKGHSDEDNHFETGGIHTHVLEVIREDILGVDDARSSE